MFFSRRQTPIARPKIQKREHLTVILRQSRYSKTGNTINTPDISTPNMSGGNNVGNTAKKSKKPNAKLTEEIIYQLKGTWLFYTHR